MPSQQPAEQLTLNIKEIRAYIIWENDLIIKESLWWQPPGAFCFIAKNSAPQCAAEMRLHFVPFLWGKSQPELYRPCYCLNVEEHLCNITFILNVSSFERWYSLNEFMRQNQFHAFYFGLICNIMNRLLVKLRTHIEDKYIYLTVACFIYPGPDNRVIRGSTGGDISPFPCDSPGDVWITSVLGCICLGNSVCHWANSSHQLDVWRLICAVEWTELPALSLALY